MDYRKIMFDIIVVAGQSNAEGNGISLEKQPYIVNEAYELVDINPYGMKLDEKGNYLGPYLMMPVETMIQPLQERKGDDAYISDLSLYFAAKFSKANMLEDNHKLLVVKAAYGGSGFALNQQGVRNPLYERLIQMCDKALSLNKNNKIIGLLWHQGEHDAFENAYLSDDERYIFYHDKLKEQFLTFRNKYKDFDIPIITGGYCFNWKKNYLSQCLMVEKATQDVCKEIKNATFINADGLKSNHEDIGNDDIIHFSKKSLKILGEKYFEAFKKLKDKEVTVTVYLKKNNQYLMLNRNKEKNDLNEGKYLGVGGHVEKGETLFAAIKREVKEETGLILNNARYVGVIHFVNDDYIEDVHVYFSDDFSGKLIECDEGTLEYIDENKMMSLPMWEGDKAFLPYIFNPSDPFEMEMIYHQKELVKINVIKK